MTPADLLTLRRQLGLTQAQFARVLGVSRMTYNAWERGRLVKGLPKWLPERIVNNLKERDAA